MSTSPIRIVTMQDVVRGDVVRHRRAATREYRLKQAAGVLMWLACVLAIAAAIGGHLRPWVQITVAAMLLVGIVALAAMHYRAASRRLDAVITRVLGR